MLTTSTRALLFASVASILSACSLYSSDPQPDAGDLDEPDADVPELDAAVSPDAAIALQDAAPPVDASPFDAAPPDSAPVDADLGIPPLCSNECPVDFTCTDYSCSCIATPDKPCLGKCAIACDGVGWVQDDAGMWYCDTPAAPYTHACHGPDSQL